MSEQTSHPLLTEEDKKRIEQEEEYRLKLQEAKFCFRCGKGIDILAEICPHCGVRQQSTALRTGKSRYVAALLAFFFGWFGAHKFYLNHWLQGVLYLLFCWTLIPALLSIFEGIAYLVMKDENFEKEASGGL